MTVTNSAFEKIKDDALKYTPRGWIIYQPDVLATRKEKHTYGLWIPLDILTQRRVRALKKHWGKKTWKSFLLKILEEYEVK